MNNMDIAVFIEKFAEAIEIEDSSLITSDTVFRELDEWDSLTYLSVIAFLDEEFNVQIENAEFKELTTIQDLYDRVTR